MVRQSPPGSALHRATDPDGAAWGLSEHLLAGANDLLSLLWWAKTENGAKNRKPPKQIPRPGVEANPDQSKYGSDPIPMDEMADWLGWSIN